MKFKDFFFHSVSPIEPMNLSLSSRFSQDFILRPLREIDHIYVKQNARRNKQGEIDINDYLVGLCCESITFPDLKDSALQESYQVMGEKNLLKTMLTAGEFSKLLHVVESLSMFEDSSSHSISEIKKK